MIANTTPAGKRGILGYFPLDPVGKIREEAVKCSRRDSFPYPPHSVKIKKEIVVAVERSAKHLFAYEQVPQIGSRVSLADRARATLVYWPRIPREASLADMQPSLGGEQAPIAAV